MPQMIDFTLPSTVPGRTLHAFRCVPEGPLTATSLWQSIWPRRASWSPATITWAMALPSAPKPITAILPSRTATAPYWTICTP